MLRIDEGEGLAAAVGTCCRAKHMNQ